MSTRRDFLRNVSVAGGLLTISQVPFDSRVYADEVKEATSGLFGKINRKTPENAAEKLVRKHAPSFYIEGEPKAGEIIKLKIVVGDDQIIHPMGQKHYIEHLNLYFHDKGVELPVAGVRFSPLVAQPVALFHLKLQEPAVLKAREFCTLHGLWETVRKIEVK